MKRGHAIGIAVHYDGKRIALGFDMDGESYLVTLSERAWLRLIAEGAQALHRITRRP